MANEGYLGVFGVAEDDAEVPRRLFRRKFSICGVTGVTGVTTGTSSSGGIAGKVVICYRRKWELNDGGGTSESV